MHLIIIFWGEIRILKIEKYGKNKRCMWLSDITIFILQLMFKKSNGPDKDKYVIP